MRIAVWYVEELGFAGRYCVTSVLRQNAVFRPWYSFFTFRSELQRLFRLPYLLNSSQLIRVEIRRYRAQMSISACSKQVFPRGEVLGDGVVGMKLSNPVHYAIPRQKMGVCSSKAVRLIGSAAYCHLIVFYNAKVMQHESGHQIFQRTVGASLCLYGRIHRHIKSDRMRDSMQAQHKNLKKISHCSHFMRPWGWF